MDSRLMNVAAEYGFYFAPVYGYYFSTGAFAWQFSDSGEHRIRSLE